MAGPGCPCAPPLPPTPWSSAASVSGDPGAPHSPFASPLRGDCRRGGGVAAGVPGRQATACKYTPRGRPRTPAPGLAPRQLPSRRSGAQLTGAGRRRGRAQRLLSSSSRGTLHLPAGRSPAPRPRHRGWGRPPGVGSPGRTAAGDGPARRASGPGLGRQVRLARLSPARPGPGAPRGPGASEGTAGKPGTRGRPGLAVSE